MNLLDESTIERFIQAVTSGVVGGDPFEDDADAIDLKTIDPVARITEEPTSDSTIPSAIAPEQPSLMDAMTTTRQERRVAEETVEQTTPGSSANFQAAQAATGMSPESWFRKWGGGPNGDLSGFIPEDKLFNVPSFGLLKPDAGKNLKALVRAARKDGINLTGSAYRSYQAQVELKQQKPTLAATPGHSNHGWGMAIDVSGLDYGSPAYQWLMKNGRKYGWVNPDWAKADGSKPEPWHWEYVGGGQGSTVRRKKTKNPKLRIALDTDPLNKIDSVDAVTSATTVFGSLIGEMQQPNVVPEPGDPQGKVTAKGLKFVPRQYRSWIIDAAEKSGLSPRLIAYVMQKESGFSADVVNFQRDSSAGAQGPMQIMPFWASTFGNKIFNDPRANVIAGAKILASYIKQQGSLKEGLAAYNAGPGNLSAGMGYAQDILDLFLGRAA